MLKRLSLINFIKLIIGIIIYFILLYNVKITIFSILYSFVITVCVVICIYYITKVQFITQEDKNKCLEHIKEKFKDKMDKIPEITDNFIKRQLFMKYLTYSLISGFASVIAIYIGVYNNITSSLSFLFSQGLMIYGAFSFSLFVLRYFYGLLKMDYQDQ